MNSGVVYKGLKYIILWGIFYLIVKYTSCGVISDIDIILIASVLTLLICILESMYNLNHKTVIPMNEGMNNIISEQERITTSNNITTNTSINNNQESNRIRDTSASRFLTELIARKNAAENMSEISSLSEMSTESIQSTQSTLSTETISTESIGSSDSSANTEYTVMEELPIDYVNENPVDRRDTIAAAITAANDNVPTSIPKLNINNGNNNANSNGNINIKVHIPGPNSPQLRNNQSDLYDTSNGKIIRPDSVVVDGTDLSSYGNNSITFDDIPAEYTKVSISGKPIKWYEQSFDPRSYAGAENLDQIAMSCGRTRNDVLVNDMIYSDFNRLPPSFNDKDFEYGYSFLPPKDWYPLPPYPPICVGSVNHMPQPVFLDSLTADLKEWHETQKITPPDSINTTYITNEMNSKA